MSKYGIYTVGNSITAGQLSPVTDVAQGCRFRYLWKDVETSDGVYNFSGIQASVMAAYNAGKYIWLQFLFRPAQIQMLPIIAALLFCSVLHTMYQRYLPVPAVQTFFTRTTPIQILKQSIKLF
jgi:hypothetical protein